MLTPIITVNFGLKTDQKKSFSSWLYKIPIARTRKIRDFWKKWYMRFYVIQLVHFKSTYVAIREGIKWDQGLLYVYCAIPVCGSGARYAGGSRHPGRPTHARLKTLATDRAKAYNPVENSTVIKPWPWPYCATSEWVGLLWYVQI